ncbi:hypothetical protein [Nocardia sp. R7R-8]|uniref:hypothetical protein n=1 Tax=Nocardia sp. R7R-8 TaxID=3459304 RepID=UPI00403E0CF5
MSSESGGTWPYGRRPEADRSPEFAGELQDITIRAPMEPNPDGSMPSGSSDRKLLLQEIFKLMKAAHNGTVRQIDYEQVRWQDTVVELKHPRPGHDHGWHYRLYTGVPRPPYHDHLVWLGAGRKPDDQFKPGEWRVSQTAEIDASERRFKTWIIARYADHL